MNGFISKFFTLIYNAILKFSNHIKGGFKKGNILFYIIILVLLSSSAIMYNVNIGEIREYYDTTIEYQKEQEFESIWYIINEAQNAAKIQADSIACNIQNDILEKCNLEELEAKLSEGETTEELDKILRSHIEGVYFSDVYTDDNGVFVATRTKIIADYNRSVAQEQPFETIKEFIDTTFANPTLSMNTYNRLIKQDTSHLLITERTKSKNPNHVLYDSIGEEELKQVYMTEGLEGLSTYTFLAPSYITAYGDVFGKPDIINRRITKNNKLIVVQMFNIYDHIIYKHKDFNTTKSIVLETKYNQVILNLYLLGIFLSIAIIGLLILMCYHINNQLIEDEEETPLDQ